MKTNSHLNTHSPFFRFFSVAIVVLTIAAPYKTIAQRAGTPADDSTKTTLAAPKSSETAYPKAVGYLSFIVPVVTFSHTTTFNFSDATSIGFPVGVNVLYSKHFGFSYEFTPTIKWSGGTSKMSSLLFDPGTMFRFDHGFTFISRLAFETSGRYGFTPVFNQVYLRTKDVNYFIAFSAPARFGNSLPASVGINVQFGLTFN